MAGGWLTRKPAIVVTVDRKRDDLKPEDRLPETIEGFAVDVRQADKLQRLRASNPALYTEVVKHVRPELKPANIPLERNLTGQRFEALQSAMISVAADAQLRLPYTPPSGAPLDPIDDVFSIICHASPDAGWPQLKQFISGATKSFTVGMYQCTSAHILDTLQSNLSGGTIFNLVMDHPPKNRTQDQSDDDTVSSLETSLGTNLHFAWALEGKNLARVSRWIFSSAYHIKVAVADGRQTWLSSGNWNNSNQPDIDPLTDPVSAEPVLRQSDRDWHVIIDHKGLAALFEKYLLNDLEIAQANQGPAASALSAEAFAELGEPEVVAASRVPRRFFAPKKITSRMKIQPLLTPDNYTPAILNLINSAEKSLFIQIPYITPSDGPDGTNLAALIEGVVQRMRAGVDVRLILSSFAKAGALEQLQSSGLDLSLVRIQNNLHNKGVIVDSAVVAIGSQNWSGPGVSSNRDATLIIHNADAAKYWESIFIHDWSSMATQQLTA
jgi:hypothetical protein